MSFLVPPSSKTISFKMTMDIRRILAIMDYDGSSTCKFYYIEHIGINMHILPSSNSQPRSFRCSSISMTAAWFPHLGSKSTPLEELLERTSLLKQEFSNWQMFSTYIFQLSQRKAIHLHIMHKYEYRAYIRQEKTAARLALKSFPQLDLASCL